MPMNEISPSTALGTAASRAARIRGLYHSLEELHHGEHWTAREDLVGLTYDIGELGKLVMAAEGRWHHEGDLPKELADKLAECLWWILSLSGRVGVDIDQAWAAKMDELETQLAASAGKLDTGKP